MEFSLREETKMLKSNAEKFMKEKSPSSFVKNILKEEIMAERKVNAIKQVLSEIPLVIRSKIHAVLR